jgi:hypothetical protein
VTFANALTQSKQSACCGTVGHLVTIASDAGWDHIGVVDFDDNDEDDVDVYGLLLFIL